MIRALAKRLIPAQLRRPLSLAVNAAREAALAPATRARASKVGSRLVSQQPGRPTVVFFAPEAGVTLYLRTQIALGRILRDRGCNVVFARCFEQLARCPVKDMLLLPHAGAEARERRACLQCYRDSAALLDGARVDFVDLRELVDAAALARVDAAMARARVTEGIDVHYEGINVGALACYDFSISHKHPISRPMTEAGRAAWLAYVRTAMTSVEMTRALIDRFRPATLVCFDEYAMMSAARLYARSRGVDARMALIAYHLNGDPRRPMAMSRLTVVREFAWRASRWPDFRDLPLPPVLVAAAVDDLVHRLTRSGAHIYSPNKTLGTAALRGSLRLDPARRTLIAYTSSSDEHDALLVNLRGLGLEAPAARDAFGDTFAWLRALIAHVESSADLQLVVRVHPRVGATARDRLAATEYESYRAEFGGDYRHVRFVWPEDPVSSYDLAEFADLALISWSSIGTELARLGVPVLSGNRSMLTIGPGEGFVEHAESPEAYFAALRRLLQGFAAPVEQLRLCFRWYHLFSLADAVDLGDAIGADGTLGEVERAKRAPQVRAMLVEGIEALDASLETLRSQPTGARARESAALKAQVARLVEFLCTGADPAAPPALRLCDHAALATAAQRGRIAMTGDDTTYDDGERLWRRDSRLVARLVRIHAELELGTG